MDNEQSKSELACLFSPFKIGSLELRNRIVMPPMGTGYPGPEGQVTQQMIAYFAERAKGGVGLIITEGFAVFDMGKCCPSFLASRDEFIPQMKELTSVVHSYGAKIGKQIWHPGRQTTQEIMKGKPVVAPSPVPSPVGGLVPDELTEEGISEIIELFIRAAERAKLAGFDLVEIHAAGGYLPSQFLSPHINLRKDRWGGSIENRTRLLTEIIKGIKARVSQDFPVCVKFNGEDFVAGGNTLIEAKQIAVLLQEAGADVLHVVAGMYGSFPCSIPPVYEKPGCFSHLAAGIKEVVQVPVIVAGRINDPRLAEKYLHEGRGDLVAMGRALLIDPKMPQKAKQGDFEGIRKCIGCNKGCIDFIETGRGDFTTCVFNPRTGREQQLVVVPATEKRKVLVIGGGLAGMEVACLAAERGHRVTLVEASEKLGGQFCLASIPPGKEEFAEQVEYLKRKLARTGVNVMLLTPVDVTWVKNFQADVIVVATGAEPVGLSVAGSNGKHVAQAWDVLAGKVPAAKKLVVIGGGAVGLETAEFLAEKGKEVIVVEMMKAVAPEMEPIIRLYLRNRLQRLGVRIFTSTRVVAIKENEVVIQKEQEETITGVGAVVLAVGARSVNALAQNLAEAGISCHLIGDVNKPRNAQAAIYEAYKVATVI
ncbi:MAG: NAD(P)/FAD-dependent oxidoreductase [Carboxydocellales bacterium]